MRPVTAFERRSLKKSGNRVVPRSKVYSFVPFAERQSGAELFCYPLNKKKTEKERISMQAMIDELAKQAEAEQAQKQAVELAKKDKKKGKPTAQALDETRGDNDEK